MTKRTLLACLAFAAASVSVPAQTPSGPDGLLWEPLAYDHATGKEPAERAMLTVPERHDAPKGRTIQLAVVRFKSRAPKPGPPTVYLAGGPGGSGIEAGRAARFPLFMALRDAGDVILFDQRGAGHSRPNLSCRERWGFDPQAPREWNSAVAIAKERVASCLAALRDQGVADISAYNTRESADDVERLRRALGVPAINLLAISYGTHLGLATMRRHESSVARVVLAGVVGPNHVLKLPSNMDRIFQRFSDEVKADPVLGRQPALTDVVRQLVGRLEKTPELVTIENQGRKVTVSFSAFDLRVMLALALEDRETMRQVPLLVGAMAQGEFRPAAAQMLGLAGAPIPTAMNLSMECASGATADRRGRIDAEIKTSLIGRGIDFPQPDICESMKVADLGDEFRAPIKTKIPTLLISGEIDLRTPPSNAEEVRAGLTAAAHVVIGRAGHDDDLLVSSPELQKLIVGFIGGQMVSDQRIELPKIPFVLPGQRP